MSHAAPSELPVTKVPAPPIGTASPEMEKRFGSTTAPSTPMPETSFRTATSRQSERSAIDMSSDKNPDPTDTVSVHRITWFAPERPVENGTVFLRPEAPEAAETPTED